MWATKYSRFNCDNEQMITVLTMWEGATCFCNNCSIISHTIIKIFSYFVTVHLKLQHTILCSLLTKSWWFILKFHEFALYLFLLLCSMMGISCSSGWSQNPSGWCQITAPPVCITQALGYRWEPSFLVS